MAFPTSATLVPLGVAPALAGITVGVYPSTNLCVTEIQRATAVGAASSLWQTVWNIEASSAYEVTFTDRMPLSTRTFSYKARHKRVGFSNSAFTKIVSGKPIAMGQVAQPSLTADGAGRYAVAGPGLTTAGVPTGAIVNLPVAISKTIRISHGEAIPQFTTDKWFFMVNGVKPNTTGATKQFIAAFTAPVGVTLKDVRFRVLRAGAASSNNMRLARNTSTGGNTLLANVTATTNTAYQTIGSTLNELVSTSFCYVIVGSLKTTSLTPVKGAEFLFADIKYTMPSLSAGY